MAQPAASFDTESDRPLVWIDGEILPRSQAKISVFDKCVLYGDGVFEGIRCYNGRIFKLATHLKRLHRSAEALFLEIPYSDDELAAAMRATLEANGFRDGYIRLVVTRGPGNLGLDIRLCPRATVFCITDTLRLFTEEQYRQGLSVIIAKRPRVPIECLDPRIKSCNYLNNILAKAEASHAGAGDAIMLAQDGQVAEGSGANLFVVKDGAIGTPPSDAGILEGVTRGFVMNELCPDLGLSCAEKRIMPEELFAADELFLSGTGAEIVALSSVDGEPIGAGEEGPITRRIRERFHEVVGENAPED